MFSKTKLIAKTVATIDKLAMGLGFRYGKFGFDFLEKMPKKKTSRL
jgi:hypothetical protein